ncbi:MAG TPA: hypothetical protein VGQ62_06590, partial [Chloroflexota bacterium]|nr:hypothetical protein [Chloroflexota bacterium]
MMLAAVTVASAEPLVSLEPAPDGTLVLIGRGWRPGQKLVVSAGPDVFAATADTVGDFEVQTGMPASGGPPVALAVRRPDPTSVAFTALPLLAPATQPNPFAV